jgi:uncharacterized protein YndB with AHSA1/START domain
MKHAGYQVGVRRTIDLPMEECWQLITLIEGVKVWLGEIEIANWEAKERYRLPYGTRGKIRVYAPPSHLRLTWQAAGWSGPSTIQLRVVPKGTKSVIALHQENLPGPAERAELKGDFLRIFDQLLNLPPLTP